MKALVFSPRALLRLTQFSIGPEWFETFGLPETETSVKRVVVDDVVYLLDVDLATDDAPVIVINLSGGDRVFMPDTQSAVLERIITVARATFTDSVRIPPNWRLHRENCIFSIMAVSRARDWKARLHFDSRPNGRDDLFVFSLLEETREFDRLDLHEQVYEAARSGLVEAVLTPAPDVSPETRAGIVLSHRLPQGFVQGATLEQWYRSKLTEEQLEFVNKPHDGPVRLRGAAGTGKTLSLVIKFLRDGIAAIDGDRPVKFGFLTHSFGSVDLVNSICESLDEKGLLFGGAENVKLEVRTLYDLAHKNLNFELDQLIPLSLDGREGRRLQAELIETILKEVAGSKIAVTQFSKISSKLRAGWDLAVAGSDKRLIAELMNEFASVLDAEGVRHGEEKGLRYVKGAYPRPAWLMELPEELDRRFVLEVHRRYRKQLGEMDTLSVDQMVGDFNSFLNSNRWDRIRERDGYDALFVDELHLFTSIERQTLHKLIRRAEDLNGRPNRPPIFMAYDLKQSPRDTFAEYGEGDTNLFSASTGLQGSDLVKLEKVFRYTPQIADFLADLDATFPAIDVPGEWDAYAGKAQLANGSPPELTIYQDELHLFSSVFPEAEKIARSAAGGGRRVAVLCASEELFDRYLETAAGQYRGRHIPIADREPCSELGHAGKRFVFSMPEYVAGLQFDTVFLIHVDAAEAPSDAGDGLRRRFISNIYLGSSRAEKTLRIASCLTRGDRSDVLDMPLERGSLVQVAAPPPRKRPK
jgi:hypothetical protein